MLKAMAFIDYQNFYYSTSNYLKSINQSGLRLDYKDLCQQIVNNISLQPAVLVKTYLFAAKPCDALLNSCNPKYKNLNTWLKSLKNKPYFEVIEGTQQIRPSMKGQEIDPNDPSTYSTTEKETDVNIAVQMVSKAYKNSYDIAVLLSNDTDYLPIVKTLHDLGKIIVLVKLPDQKVYKFENYVDEIFQIDYSFFQRVLNNEERLPFECFEDIEG